MIAVHVYNIYREIDTPRPYYHAKCHTDVWIMGGQDKIYIGLLLGAGPDVSGPTRKALRELIDHVFAAAQALIDSHDLKDEKDLLDVANTLARILEASEYTNAGKGSELTTDGTIECDSSVILSGRSRTFASVGAVPDVGNPTALTTELVKLQLSENKTPRSTPNCIVGSGARDYGARLGVFSSAAEKNLITDRAKQSFEKWSQVDSQRYMDTVGLILIHKGTTCVVSSSGGALLKDPGRVGPAFLVGCGLDSRERIASVCSGFGEDIVTARLASLSCLPDLEMADLAEHVERVYLQRQPPQFGVLRSVQCEGCHGVHFEWIHTTPSMVCAYGLATPQTEPQYCTVFSRRPEEGGNKVV